MYIRVLVGFVENFREPIGNARKGPIIFQCPTK